MEGLCLYFDDDSSLAGEKPP